MGPDFVAALPVGRFHGVGPVTEAKMKRLGIETGADLRAWGRTACARPSGRSGAYYTRSPAGSTCGPVRAHRVRKSIGAETTFSADTAAFDGPGRRLAPLFDKVWAGAEAKGMRARTVTLELKFSDFAQVTRARSLPVPVVDRADLERIGQRQAGHRPYGRVVWAQSFKRDLRDVLDLQRELAERITSLVGIRLTPGERVRLARARPIDPYVHRQVLLARHHAEKATDCERPCTTSRPLSRGIP